MNTFIFTPSRPCVKALLTGVALLLALVFMASCNGGAQPPAEISTQGEQTTAAIETTQPPATQGQGAQTTTTTELPKTQLPATQSRGTQTTTTTAAPKTQPPDALQYPDLPQLTVYQLHTVASRVLPPVQAIQGTTSWTWASGQSV
ncbi:MAG: hypothetical protein FWF60_02495, partial [Oscillospiraceae bacterium]|nr:hypothetical protein [Oscillospiraceae bacterium]